MTDTNKLKGAIIASGYTQSKVAQFLGITLQGFYKKLHNKSEFKASEISKLCQSLNIDNKEAVFFAHNVDENQQNVL